jgi:hypothetical protein
MMIRLVPDDSHSGKTNNFLYSNIFEYADEQRTSLMTESVNHGPNYFMLSFIPDFNQRASTISDIGLHS